MWCRRKWRFPPAPYPQLALPGHRHADARVRPFGAEHSAEIPGQADSAELPAGVRRKEVAVTPAGVAPRRNTRGATQDKLVAHELAVVLPQGAVRRAITRIARMATRGPLPDIAKQLA